MCTAEELAAILTLGGGGSEPQLSQTRFRMELVRNWGIGPGARVLEIGCGQGDTTTALADAVGPTGSVLAVDLASPTYGAPTTLGESARRIKASPLGKQIEFRFEFDLLDPSSELPQAFDFVVLAHCTWYFESLHVLRQMLARIRALTSKICLSEWDMEPQSSEQIAHFLAVLIQGQVEAFKSNSQANVRTPYSVETLRRLLDETGWSVLSECRIDTSALADARWEIRECLENSVAEASRLPVSDKFKELTTSMTDVLRRFSDRESVRPLPAYSIVAKS